MGNYLLVLLFLSQAHSLAHGEIEYASHSTCPQSFPEKPIEQMIAGLGKYANLKLHSTYQLTF